MSAAHARGGETGEASVRRFREVHYHRFRLGSRSNIHGSCLLRSHLPIRLPRPHTMQMIYAHPPPGIGRRRGMAPQWQEPFAQDAPDPASFARSVVREIKDERRRVAQWLSAHRAIARTHVIVATQTGFHFFVAGFGYWNVLDIDLHLQNESCVGVKAFEVSVAHAAGQSRSESRSEEQDRHEDDLDSIDQAELPVLIIALTTYVKRSSETKSGIVDESGSYRLYALGADSLPPLTPEFIEKHARRDLSDTKGPAAEKDIAEREPAPRASSQPAPATYGDDSVPPRRCASESQPPLAESDGMSGDVQPSVIQDIPINSFAYLEERLFSLTVTDSTLGLDLDYLPFRISQDVSDGMPPVLLVAGNDNIVHRYALGRDQILEIEPLLCPKTDVALTFTAFDARVIGPYHVQVTAHQEFAVALQASRALTTEESASAAASGDPTFMRKLLIADEEIYDAAPVIITIFTPDSKCIDRTAFDYKITHRISTNADAVSGPESGADSKRLLAGDIYNAEWPIGTMGAFPSPAEIGTVHAESEAQPQVHVLIGFVGEDAIIYHDVPVAGLDPVPTLVGGIAGRVPDSAAHISGRLGGHGGVFALAGSSKEGIITAVHFDDLDYDGTKEIIVGTVSGAVLVYKAVPERGYVLVWKRRFPAAVYGIFSADINCDGANELVVVTLLGVHIMQPNLAHVRAKLLRQLVLADKASEA